MVEALITLVCVGLGALLGDAIPAHPHPYIGAMIGFLFGIFACLGTSDYVGKLIESAFHD